MSKKREPLGKSFSSIMENLSNTNETVLEPFEKHINEKSIMKNTQAATQARFIKGGVIQKTLPVLNENSPSKSFELDIVGRILRQKREDKGLSVADVSETLCYRKSIIKAIESGDWNSLPHIVYVKGYVRKYSSLLGVSDEIDSYLTEKLEDVPTEQAKDEPAQLYEQKKLYEIHMPRKMALKFPSIFHIPKIPKAILFYFSIMLLVIGFFVFDYLHKDRKISSKLENAVQVANSVSTVEDNKVIPQIADVKKLMITCHERTWVSIIIDGAEKKELMLKPEEVVILNAKERFDLLVGNAGGIKIFLNGKETGFTGEKGQVKKITFS